MRGKASSRAANHTLKTGGHGAKDLLCPQSFLGVSQWAILPGPANPLYRICTHLTRQSETGHEGEDVGAVSDLPRHEGGQGGKNAAAGPTQSVVLELEREKRILWL